MAPVDAVDTVSTWVTKFMLLISSRLIPLHQLPSIASARTREAPNNTAAATAKNRECVRNIMRSSLTGIAQKKNISDGFRNADALAVPGHHGKQFKPVKIGAWPL